MELSPQAVFATTFKLVKRGYDPDEVNSFKAQVASSIESAQNQAAAMEARARAAVAKLQELSQQAAVAPTTTSTPSGDEAAVISRTLLLAQRTADQTIADATAEAEAVRTEARLESASAIETARAAAAKLVDDARFEARRAADDERVRAEGEVQALIAKREFLLADVEHLEQFARAQRDRLREASTALAEVADGPTFTEMRRPLLSAASDALVTDDPVTEDRGADASGPLPAPSADELPVDDQAPIAVSPEPALPVVDVHQVRQHHHDDEPVEDTPRESSALQGSFVDDLVDHDDTPESTSVPNGGMFRIVGDDLR